MTAAPTMGPIHIQHNPVLQNVLAYGAETYVPDHDICRLSYYLKCCTIGCGIDLFANLPLIDYQVAHLLHETLQDVVVRLALEVFKLDSLLNKPFILDENHQDLMQLSLRQRFVVTEPFPTYVQYYVLYKQYTI